jgi:hypothetical protein
LLLFCLQALACLSLANPGSSRPFLPQASSSPILPSDSQSQFIKYLQDPLDVSSTTPQETRPITLDDVETVINGLGAVTEDLNKAVRNYRKHLDEAVSKYDHGSLSADADLMGGDPGIAQAAIRKAFAARGLAVAEGNSEYRPSFLTDLIEIQDLISAARQRISGSDAVSRWLLVVSPNELNSGEAKKKNIKHVQLEKAREAAKVAATKALADLPIPLPEDNSAKDESYFDLVFAGLDSSPRRGQPNGNGAPQENSRQISSPSLPLHSEQDMRITLINEGGYRLALTDTGMKDPQGRRFFYQEGWVQRGSVVLRKAQLVGVDPSTGQHILIKRYPPREFSGSVQDAYGRAGLNETRSVKPPDIEPPRQEVESALAQVAGAPERLLATRQRYMSALRTDLARSDQLHLDKGESSLDAGLPDQTRLLLYALRGHVLRAAIVLEAENDVRGETKKAEQSIEVLKRLAAWANRATPELSRPTLPASEWDRLQAKADDAIYVAREAMASALAALPPDDADHDATFPELFKGGIVHMLSVRASTEPGRAVWQEVWDWDAPASGRRRARQRIDTIVVDPKTGNQIRISHQMRYYAVDSDESLVDAYDRLGGPVAPPMEVYVPPDLFRDPPSPASISAAEPVRGTEVW